MPKNDEEEKRTKNGGGGKNQNSNGKSSAAAAEECDFIDEKISTCSSSSPVSLSSCSPSSSSSNSSSSSSSRARRNWCVFSQRLRESLRNDGQFSSDSLILFDLVPASDSSSAQSSDSWWICSKAPNEGETNPRRFFRFSYPPSKISLDSLARGFDNTGNVRIWPGSEALAYLMLQKEHSTEPQQVLELGAGFLGLTSFLLASVNSNNSTFYITDGNPESVRSLQKICAQNNQKFSKNSIKISQLLWGDTDLLPLRFDTILAADCVFFAELHEKLLTCIETHLKVGGVCYISSPRRKGSLQKFVECVENSWTKFEVEILDEWNRQLEGMLGGLWTDVVEKDEKLPVVVALRLRCGSP